MTVISCEEIMKIVMLEAVEGASRMKKGKWQGSAWWNVKFKEAVIKEIALRMTSLKGVSVSSINDRLNYWSEAIFFVLL